MNKLRYFKRKLTIPNMATRVQVILPIAAAAFIVGIVGILSILWQRTLIFRRKKKHHSV